VDHIDELRSKSFYQSQPFEVNLMQEGAIDQGLQKLFLLNF
jgi:hypothetical protein